MKKEQHDVNKIADRFTPVLLILVIGFALLYLYIPSLISTILVKIILALSALTASILYFQRVRTLSVSSTTPISDTLVTLSGVYLTLVIFSPTLFDEPLPIFWSLVLIVVGVIGRLILFDSILISFLSTLQNMFINFFQWIIGPFNLIRFVLFFSGLGLIIGSFYSFEFLLSVFLGYSFISASIIISLWNPQSPPFSLRFIGILVSIYFFTRIFRNFDNLEILFGSFLLSVSLVAWGLGRANLLRFYNFSKEIVPILIEMTRSLFRAIFVYLRNNKLSIFRFIFVAFGIILLLFGIFSDIKYIALGILSISIAYIDKIYHFIRRQTVNMVTYIRNNPIGSIQRLSLLLTPFAYFFLPRESNLHLISSLLLLSIAIGPTVIRSVWSVFSEFVKSTYQWLKYNFQNHPIGSLQVTSLILAIFAFIFLPKSNFVFGLSLRFFISLSLVILGLTPSIISWLIDFIPEFLTGAMQVIENVIEYIQKNTTKSIQIMALILTPITYFVLPSESSLNLIAALIFLSIGIGPSILPPLWSFISGVSISLYQWLKYNFQNHPIGSLQVTSLILAILAFVILPKTDFVFGLSLRSFASFSFVILGLSPTLLSWIKRLIPVFNNIAIAIYSYLSRLLGNSNFYLFSSLGISGYFGFSLPDDQITIKLISLFIFSISLSLLGNSYLMRFYDTIHLGIKNTLGTLLDLLFNIRIMLNLISLVSLIIGVFNLIPDEYRFYGYTRIGLIVFSILLYIFTDEWRRERFIQFIIRTLNNLFNNIFVLAFILLGFGFLTISFGIIFSGTISFVSSLFSGVDSTLVTTIIALFMIAIGFVTIQQALSRREDLRITGGAKE